MVKIIVDACYEFKEIGKAEDYNRLLCSAKSGKIVWLEELKNQQDAIVLQYDGRLLLSENVELFKDCDDATLPKNTIAQIDKIGLSEIAYFPQWTEDRQRIAEVLLLPPDYYGGHFYDRYRILSSMNNLQYPSINLYDLYAAGDLEKEINVFAARRVNCTI